MVGVFEHYADFYVLGLSACETPIMDTIYQLEPNTVSWVIVSGWVNVVVNYVFVNFKEIKIKAYLLRPPKTISQPFSFKLGVHSFLRFGTGLKRFNTHFVSDQWLYTCGSCV